VLSERLKDYPCNCKALKNKYATGSGWSLSKGKWLAKSGKSFQHWISDLFIMTTAII
jgi:hypothetical protein